jgi:FK506-binding protein 4/5
MKLRETTRTEFSKYTLEKGDSDQIVEEGEWFQVELKALFNLESLTGLNQNHETLLGLRLHTDKFSVLRQRMGYFESQVQSVLHRAVAQMKLNEVAHVSFEIDPIVLDESFTEVVDKQKSPVFIDLKFELKLIKIEKLDSYVPIYQLNEKQLLEIAQEHKKDANSLYQRHLTRTAFERYHKSISYLIIAEQVLNVKMAKNSEESIPEVEVEDIEAFKNEIDKLKSQLYANFSACQLKSHNYKMAIVNCTKCLQFDAHNVKALYRRAQAYSSVNDFDESIADLSKAIALNPTDDELKQKLAQVEKLRKNYNNLMSSNLKKMFA